MTMTAKMSDMNVNAVPVVFLDRDGVINVQAAPHQYITKWEDFEYLPGVYEALRLLNAEDYHVVIVSNQRCIARGMATTGEIDMLHKQMISDVTAHGGRIDGVYYCPHGISDQCSCRKPRPGMLEHAERDLKTHGKTIDRSVSWMIGDSGSDVQAGISFGVNTVHILPDGKAQVPSLVIPGDGMLHINANSLLEAVRAILEVRAA